MSEEIISIGIKQLYCKYCNSNITNNILFPIEYNDKIVCNYCYTTNSIREQLNINKSTYLIEKEVKPTDIKKEVYDFLMKPKYDLKFYVSLILILITLGIIEFLILSRIRF